MKVLVVGAGGREHAILWKLKQSPKVKELYCPEMGISEIANLVPVEATDVEGITSFAKDNNMDFVVVAPDDPLAAGMLDALLDAGIRAFGPNKSAAVIEASKVFAKDLMKKYNIPTAQYEVFDDSLKAREYIRTVSFPVVVKADGLALGKGVIICNNEKEALDAISSIMEENKFGQGGKRIVIEEYITDRKFQFWLLLTERPLFPWSAPRTTKSF